MKQGYAMYVYYVFLWSLNMFVCVTTQEIFFVQSSQTSVRDIPLGKT